MSATEVAVRALDAEPVRRLLRRLGRWHGTLVLAHHRIGTAEDGPLHPALFSATAEGFAGQLDVLEHEAEVVDAADAGVRHPGRGRRVAITFDDGYRDTAEVAWPLLRARGLPATVFLATGFLGARRLAWWDELAWIAGASGWPAAVRDRLCAQYASRPAPDAERLLARVRAASPSGPAPPAAADGVWMDWDQARAMRDEGATFGGHTVTHPVLSRVDDARLGREVEGCRAALEHHLGVGMALFSHPLGGADDVDGRVAGPLRRAGVELGFACSGGVARPGHDPAWRVPRACAPPADDAPAARCRTFVALPGVFARC
jgi:peptidoglycan/xylan/chitin deacetylase (PgdA/CDA1 family)